MKVAAMEKSGGRWRTGTADELYKENTYALTNVYPIRARILRSDGFGFTNFAPRKRVEMRRGFDRRIVFGTKEDFCGNSVWRLLFVLWI